jgi:hypothetical protein
MRPILHAGLFSVLVACGGGNDQPDALIIIPDADIDAQDIDAPIDAREFDFTCMNNPAPTTATNPVLVAGTAQNFDIVAQAPVPVADATVGAFQLDGDPIGANDTSDANGNWDLSVPSGGTPIDGYIQATKAGHRTVRIYPPEPMRADQANIPALLLANGTFNTLVTLANAQQGAGNGTIGMVVLDCVGTPMGGVVISAKQNNTEVGMQQDLGLLQEGLWIVFDVPPGETEVSATYNGMALRPHMVEVVAATTSTTVVNPGFQN